MAKRLYLSLIAAVTVLTAMAQVNADQVMRIGRNSLYFEDYVLSIQYFNQAIAARPYLAQPYFYRAIAKLNLDDFSGAEADATLAIERNPFITDAYEVRGVARQNMGRNADAVADYDKALESYPYSRGLLYNKAVAQQEMNDTVGADSTYTRLLRYHPGFDGGYIGRARLSLMRRDTVGALADIDRALAVNTNAVNAHLMKAEIAMNRRNFEDARASMDEAIKLQPHVAGFFINRAYIRYNLDDYFGAMADFDYTLQLEPLNTTALFNRALLRAEVHDTNHAIEDLTQVLTLKPDDYRALFNRAILYKEIGAHREAIADLDRLLEAFPDFSAAYFLRFDARRSLGDRRADSDYRKSLALAKKRIDVDRDKFIEMTNPDSVGGESQEEIEARFKSLITVADNVTADEVYNNKDIKGKVQDRNIAIELEPMFSLTYYTSPTELKPDGEYIKEVTDINDTRMLNFRLQITNHPPRLTDEETFAAHQRSIEAYNSWMNGHTPRAIDYFGRAMDYMTLRDYDRAIADLGEALRLTPDFAIALLARAEAYMSQQNDESDKDVVSTPMAGVRERRAIADIDAAIKLAPTLAIAHYNKGVILAGMQDYTSALAAFNRAIELNGSFGEAYYNRGYVYFRLGNRDAGAADLSKAGELGIVSSYNLLKRMSR